MDGRLDILLDIAFYAHCYFPYPGRTDLHGMLTPVFHHMTGQMDAQIAFSRDGLIWYRPERRPIVTLGPPGSGEDCMIGASGIVKLGDGRWGATYWAESQLHNIKKESVATPVPAEAAQKDGMGLMGEAPLLRFRGPDRGAVAPYPPSTGAMTSCA